MGIKIPEIDNNQFIPISVRQKMMEDAIAAEKERCDTRRFIITTIIGTVAAVASVVAATASVIACLT